jgi:putative copper export protein
MLLASLAPAVDTIRLSLHVLGATVWVGGQIVVAGLLPTLRSLGGDAPKKVARAFARLQWPAYLLLLITGVWNVAAVHKGQPSAWRAVLGVKIGVVVLAGVGAGLHQRAATKTGLAVWGAVAGVSSLAALVLGVLLAG